jgi:heat shock protein HslJ
MKAVVGFFFFILILAGLAFVMLQGRQMAQQNLSGGGSGLTGITWRPTHIGSEEISRDTSIFVQFEVDGSIKGNGGCNSFSGSLKTTDGNLGVGPLAATRMACKESVMDLEMEFLDALQSMQTYELSGKRLVFMDGDQKLLAEFQAAEDAG